MLITKNLKLVVVVQSSRKIFYGHPEVFYIFLILRLVSPRLKLRGQDKFVCVF